MSQAPFSYASDGSILALADGPELYAFGANDGPLWRAMAEGILVAVAARQRQVVSLDTEGKLVAWRGLDGARQEEAYTDVRGGRALAVRGDGRIAVVGQDTLWVGSLEGGVAQPIPGVRCAAWSGDTLGYGLEGGALGRLDADSKPLPPVALGGPVAALAPRPDGAWAAAVGAEVVLVSKDGKLGLRVNLPGAVEDLAVTADGAVFAARIGRAVHLGELGSGRLLGTIELQRDAGGVGFGPEAWLAVGYDEGEANRVDLSTGQVRKTEAAVGKVAGRWGIEARFEPMHVRQAITTVRTAGKAIAVHIQHGQDSGGGCLQSCLIFAAVTFLCSGCSGVLAGLYYFVYLG